MKLSAWMLAVICSMAGCISRPVSSLDPILSKEDRVEVLSHRDLDLLFVIDNSNSMETEQASLRANFTRIIQALDGEEGLPNLHIAVVTTDVGVRTYQGNCGNGGFNPGQLVDASATCAGTPDRFLIDLDDGAGGRSCNYEGTIEEAFDCVANVGIGGCGFEQPLEAMKRGLTQGRDIGFLRDDAYLGIVFITDEDDCSAQNDNLFASDGTNNLSSPLGKLESFRCFEFGVECDGAADPRSLGPRSNCRPRAPDLTDARPDLVDIGSYGDFLRSLKGSNEQLLLASIQGPLDPVIVASDPVRQRELAFSCGSDNQAAQAIPPIRLNAFLDQAPAEATRASICDEDLSDAVQQIANFIGDRGRGCLKNIVDVDTNTPGVQPECNVAELEAGVETLMEECDTPSDPGASSNLPCYAIAVNPECTLEEHKLAVAAYYAEGAVPPAARIVTRCRLQ
jgi:hypothetical protein